MKVLKRKLCDARDPAQFGYNGDDFGLPRKRQRLMEVDTPNFLGHNRIPQRSHTARGLKRKFDSFLEQSPNYHPIPAEFPTTKKLKPFYEQHKAIVPVNPNPQNLGSKFTALKPINAQIYTSLTKYIPPYASAEQLNRAIVPYTAPLPFEKIAAKIISDQEKENPSSQDEVPMSL
eukprot:TRINITY_DN14076_c0_g1_i1.p1 TRINITY_DN14076_c0_g1~~TRINITY_DN14076_c0_g1_i1.p1  ORF type:complete len:183 (+),score=27.96 TRINITY_DN14076_c0_g1_i1:25-549(+)